MSEIPIYIEMDEEIEGLLASGGLTIQDILHKEGIEASVKFGALPYPDEEEARTKDFGTIIMAGGVFSASVFLISKAITNILREIHNKPIYDTYSELMPVSDEKGNVLLDPKTQKPILIPVKKHFVFEPGKTPGEEVFEVKAGLKGLVMKFGTKQNPPGN
jgi:selenophosphate synthase